MAALATTFPTLLDWAKRLDPDGTTADVAELLNQNNGILDDMVFIEGNLPTGNRTTVRTALPTVTFRMLNAGVLPSKSTTAQIDDQCAIMEAFSNVDCALANLNGNQRRFRLSEDSSFTEAMNQTAATKIFYGNTGTAQEEFTGLAPRYGAISGATNSGNVISGSGVGTDNTSVWLVQWGDQTAMGIFPKGSKAGLSHEDLGKIMLQSANGVAGAQMMAYVSHWVWNIGITVRDWRSVVRICNIDTSNLVAKSSAADLPELMIKAMYRLPKLGYGRKVFYMNRTAAQSLDIQRRDDVISGGGLTYDVVDGRRTMSFRGIPIKIVDALLNTEATVV